MTFEIEQRAGADQSPVVEPTKPRLLGVLGPGLITGASDDDPSGIATYSRAGAIRLRARLDLAVHISTDDRDPGRQRPDR